MRNHAGKALRGGLVEHRVRLARRNPEAHRGDLDLHSRRIERLLDQFAARFDVETARFEHDGQWKERSRSRARTFRAPAPNTRRPLGAPSVRPAVERFRVPEEAKRARTRSNATHRYWVTARRLSVPVYVPGVVVWPVRSSWSSRSIVRFDFLFAPVIVSLNSVRLPLAVPTLPTAFCVNAVNEVGAPGAPAVVTRPFTKAGGDVERPVRHRRRGAREVPDERDGGRRRIDVPRGR